MESYVYVITSRARSYIYVGLSTKPNKRLLDHTRGRNKKTKAHRPFNLVLLRRYPSRSLARDAEKRLKTGYGKEQLKKIMPEWRNW